MKRLPKTKSGRVLVAIRDKMIAEAKEKFTNDSHYDPFEDYTAIARIASLNKRIKKRCEREDKKSVEQLPLMNSFTLKFIKQGKKRTTTETFYTSTMYKAKKLVKLAYGNDTKFIN